MIRLRSTSRCGAVGLRACRLSRRFVSSIQYQPRSPISGTTCHPALPWIRRRASLSVAAQTSVTVDDNIPSRSESVPIRTRTITRWECGKRSRKGSVDFQPDKAEPRGRPGIAIARSVSPQETEPSPSLGSWYWLCPA